MRRKLVCLSDPALANYATLERLLPVEQEKVIQIGRGTSKPDISILITEDVVLGRVIHDVQSIGVTILNPSKVGFFLIDPGATECRINGQQAAPSTLYLPQDGEGFHIRGGQRETIGVILDRDRFASTLAALENIGREDVELSNLALCFSPEVGSRLRHKLRAILVAYCSTVESPYYGDSENLEDLIYGLLLDAYLQRSPERGPENRSFISPHRVVRKAEEYFFGAGNFKASLADLCKAANVSKSTLYGAFHSLYGEPPLSYFRKRQLSLAHAALSEVRRERGIITKIAMDNGLTELGRFSREYRQIYGTTPSAMLKLSASA